MTAAAAAAATRDCSWLRGEANRSISSERSTEYIRVCGGGVGGDKEADSRTRWDNEADDAAAVEDMVLRFRPQQHIFRNLMRQLRCQWQRSLFSSSGGGGVKGAVENCRTAAGSEAPAGHHCYNCDAAGR